MDHAYNPAMPRMLILILLLFAPALWAQYDIEVRVGVGDVVAPPYTRVRVGIMRSDTRPFVGRVVVVIGAQSFGGRRGPPVDSGEVQIVQDVTLEEGVTSRVVTLDVPVSSRYSMEVRLERHISGDAYEMMAMRQESPPMISDERKLVGFVSSTRLALAQQFLFYRAVEIPVAELPDSWKPLACFDAIVVNDDRLSRAQSAALADYVTAGGTVVISPSSRASFNPETPAGQLLRIPATAEQKTMRLADFGNILIRPLREAGMSMHMPEFEDGSGRVTVPEEGTVASSEALPMPNPDSPFTYWPNAGRALPVEGAQGLVSIARVGAGNLLLLHADISSAPFTVGDGLPTAAAVNLIDAAIAGAGDGTNQTPSRMLATVNMRDHIDIAGRRIPGRDGMVIMLLLYIGMAGVGMFLLARKVKRPELFPAALLVAAALSVGLVFGFGEIYKRAGEKVNTARILVSDETTDRNAIFSVGCAYAIDGGEYEFVNSRRMMLIPAGLDARFGGVRGMPGDALAYSTGFTAGEARTTVHDLSRWQNVFFLQREPSNLEGFKLEVSHAAGATTVVNRSAHELRACVLLIGGFDATSGKSSCQWHYVSRLGAAGSSDASVTFTESTRIGDDTLELSRRIEEDADTESYMALATMFSVTPADRSMLTPTLVQLEARLKFGGLLPGDGEFLMMSVLPKAALPASGIGAQGVEDDEIGSANLWMVRGGVETR